MSEQGKLAPEGKYMGLVFKDGYEFARFIEDICWIVSNVQGFPGGAVEQKHLELSSVTCPRPLSY